MSKAITNNNPGNLRFNGQVGATNNNGFAKFATPQDGYVALMNDILSKVTGNTSTGLKPTSTLADFAKVYAPPSENDTAGYALNLANQLKTSPDTPLSQLESRVPEMAQAIAQNEDKQFASKYKLDANKSSQTGTSLAQNTPSSSKSPVDFIKSMLPSGLKLEDILSSGITHASAQEQAPSNVQNMPLMQQNAPQLLSKGLLNSKGSK